MSEIYTNLGNICGICVREPPQSHLWDTRGHGEVGGVALGGWWDGGWRDWDGETGGGGDGDGGRVRPSTETAGKCVRSKQIHET
jgi:hypothetical protein